MNDESIYVNVVVLGYEEKQLQIKLVDGSVLTFLLDDKEICSADWDNNFKHVFERALKIWE